MTKIFIAVAVMMLTCVGVAILLALITNGSESAKKVAQEFFGSPL